ncbi:hypothetical protein FEM48_Zijuj10G0148700 [Ziziphus jujuba var. spinosa]|uniref:Terpene synthase N-terminal domain-containing protein n=1 Tax=Ziziphus jujuba var. spinosa TaxID=714518 RepID=A0A978UP15_ZIZJJ|nr:hypothetical protein FEM48_Zijuj10G0148700 [Ziziphus jujuba var. spinosa]
MSSRSAPLLIPVRPDLLITSNLQIKPFAGVWSRGSMVKRHDFDFKAKCGRISKPRTQAGDRVLSIKSTLGSMNDGEISISAYDTAWVGLVQDINGSDRPQFPSTLQWIANNQLPDGSWGDHQIFLAHDRLLNTLACVIALKSWNIHPQKCQKGMKFFKENLSKLKTENAEHMPGGFEVAFPSLLEMARKINLQVPDQDSPILQDIYARRHIKLSRIPRDIMQQVPTTLLYSLEGMPDLDWEKLLKLQLLDGSFLFSPSSTAFALNETKDQNCLKYLTSVVQRFNGGVPNVYPVDLFERIWAVDRLQRLGICRIFEPEIKECMDYVYRYWTDKGICWARNTKIEDIDDTAMGFRLLRLHGYKVSADVFGHFKKGGEFFVFPGQSMEAVTGMFNLYRASQVIFPGEKILEDAKDFSSKFLRQKRASSELLDKWIITKDLPGEVGYALEVPWYASLPRVESRFYIEQYGGENDVWIGKTLYRMPYVNNNEYLELAKLDYNNCQALHRMEWDKTQNIFEEERANERFAWAKTTALIHTIESHFRKDESSCLKQRTDFVYEFRTRANNMRDSDIPRRLNTKNKGHGLVEVLLRTLNHLSRDTHGSDISDHLLQAWEKFLVKWQEEGDIHHGEAELLVRTINLSADPTMMDFQLSSMNPQYQRLFNITNRICCELCNYQDKEHQMYENGSYNIKTEGITTPQIESGMQELVELVLQDSSLDGINSKVKQTFLTVAKTFYYVAYFDVETISYHIGKVLFHRVG